VTVKVDDPDAGLRFGPDLVHHLVADIDALSSDGNGGDAEVAVLPAQTQ
jgi:hypothetical protein